jgi:predicted RNA binding protein YcfA (HicA-like mRNA interferase family)
MGNNRPVKTKHWVSFLENHGCKYLRTRASHYHYKCPNCFRTITHRENEKEIPAMHLKANLNTMGKTLADLYKWIEENC